MVHVLLVHKKSRYSYCPTGIFNSPDMVDALLVHRMSRYGCCPACISKSPDMVDSLLAHKNPDMVDALLAQKKIHIWLISCWYIKNLDMVIVRLEFSK